MNTKNIRAVAGALLATISVSITAHGAERTMKVSTFLPPTHHLSPIIRDLAKDLSEASNGEVTLDVYEAEALGKAVEQLDITIEGLADISLFCTSYTPSRFPLAGMFELPFFAKAGAQGNKVAQAVVAEGLLDSEMTDIKPLILFTTAPAQIFSNRKLEKKEDFTGLRIVGLGPVWSQTWSLLGAQNVTMCWPDIYLALERGTIDATPGNWAASDGWKWQEIVEYPTEISIMGGFFCGTAMNKESWASLSPETQAKWTEIAADYALRMTAAYDERDEKSRVIWREAGRTIVKFPEEEKRRVAEALLPIWQDWVKKNEAAGRPAKRMYDIYKQTFEAEGESVVMQLPD